MRPSLSLVALALALTGCSKCGGSSDASSTGVSSAVPSVIASAASPTSFDFPEVKDTGRGRATAALRSALGAYGITYDAASLERECKVDDDGASIDDIEDVADKYGLDAAQVIVPVEHVLLPEAKMLPAIVIVEGDDDEDEFVLAWKVQGEDVQVMDPTAGRGTMPRGELGANLYVHEQKMAADELRATMTTPSYQDGLRARMAAVGIAKDKAAALLARAAADPGWKGFAAIDASLRALDDEVKGDAAEANVGKALDCALKKACDGAPALPSEMWSAEEADGGKVKVRGALVLAIAGKKAAPAP